MFPNTYFAPVYFVDEYFPPTGEVVTVSVKTQSGGAGGGGGTFHFGKAIDEEIGIRIRNDDREILELVNVIMRVVKR